ncbi:MAG: ABC transporter permease [Saprospiraceae bacterium]|nr:ABC transporter permease [Saprospiraceae bacterium]
MNLFKETLVLLRKEALLELRMNYAISGILLYVFSTVFIVYVAFVQLQPQVWNALFWIITLFASVNAIVKSFIQENSARQLYYYSIANPIAILLSKIIYNALLLMVLSVLCWVGLGFVGGNPVKDVGQFVLAIFLASVGFSITFTFISAISAKADNSATLMAILSFPLVIPILLTLIKLSANALRLLNDTGIMKDVWALVGIDLMLLAVALVLYPFLWKD